MNILSPDMFEDEDGDLIVKREFFMMGMVVNYTRPKVKETFRRLRREGHPPNAVMMDMLGTNQNKILATRCPQLKAYYLRGNTIDLILEAFHREREGAQVVPIKSKGPIPERVVLEGGGAQVNTIRTGSDLSPELQKKLDFLDVLVGHLCYRDSLLPPKDVHMTFLM